MKEHIRDSKLEYLLKGILTLSTLDECYEFFCDLCTPYELQEMAQRMQAAKMLKDGRIYSEIAAKTGLSTATISRVNRCLRFGNAGYVRVLEDLDNLERRQWRDR